MLESGPKRGAESAAGSTRTPATAVELMLACSVRSSESPAMPTNRTIGRRAPVAAKAGLRKEGGGDRDGPGLEGGHDAVDGVRVGVVVEAGRRRAELQDEVLQQRLPNPPPRPTAQIAFRGLFLLRLPAPLYTPAYIECSPRPEDQGVPYRSSPQHNGADSEPGPSPLDSGLQGMVWSSFAIEVDSTSAHTPAQIGCALERAPRCPGDASTHVSSLPCVLSPAPPCPPLPARSPLLGPGRSRRGWSSR